MTFFKKYLLPGFVFQSIIIGGGYGTGREMVEFFLTQGPVGGYLGIAVATVIWSTVLAISFELARLGKHYDYRSFLKGLLGKGWIGYEIVYVTTVILVVSVLGSASGKLMHQTFHLAEISGIIIMMIAVGVLVFFGSSLIEKALSIWSFALYAVYIVLVVACYLSFGDVIRETGAIHEQGSRWFLAGVKYAAYNVGILPAILFSTRHIETRKEALTSGVLAGVLAIMPGVFIYTAMLSDYPGILSEAIPSNLLFGKLGLPAFQLIFQIVLFGTFIETGVGLIHGFNERIAGVFQQQRREMPSLLRAAIAIVILLIAIFVADAFGIITLIAKGYVALTWGYWLVFVLPVLTLGTWRILKRKTNGEFEKI